MHKQQIRARSRVLVPFPIALPKIVHVNALECWKTSSHNSKRLARQLFAGADADACEPRAHLRNDEVTISLVTTVVK